MGHHYMRSNMGNPHYMRSNMGYNYMRSNMGHQHLRSNMGQQYQQPHYLRSNNRGYQPNYMYMRSNRGQPIQYARGWNFNYRRSYQPSYQHQYPPRAKYDQRSHFKRYHKKQDLLRTPNVLCSRCNNESLDSSSDNDEEVKIDTYNDTSTMPDLRQSKSVYQLNAISASEMATLEKEVGYLKLSDFTHLREKYETRKQTLTLLKHQLTMFSPQYKEESKKEKKEQNQELLKSNVVNSNPLHVLNATYAEKRGPVYFWMTDISRLGFEYLLNGDSEIKLKINPRCFRLVR